MKKILCCILLAMTLALTLIPFGAVSAADRGKAVFIYQAVDGKIGAGDQAFIDHLKGLGFSVTSISHEKCKTEDANGAALLVVVESVSSANIKGKFAKISTPILCYEMAAWTDIGFGAQVAAAAADSTHKVTLTENHEIVKALKTTTFDMYKEKAHVVDFDNATKGEGGVLIGKASANSSHYVVYDKGAKLCDGTTASSRRAAGSLHGQTAVSLSADGWAFIDSVINWLSPIPVVTTAATTKAASMTATAKAAATSTAKSAQTADPTVILLALAAVSTLTAGVVRKRK